MPRESFNRVWATDPLPDQFAEPPESRFQTGHVGGAQGELPEASHENWRQNRLDVALQQIERDGAMEWLPDVPYAIGAAARHNGINWMAAIASEGVEPGSAQDEGHWQAMGVASSVRIEPIDQVPSANNVQEALAALGAHPLGADQTWQDVTGQRQGGVTYTNTTGRTIFVSARVNGYSAANFTNLYNNGVIIAGYKNQSINSNGEPAFDQCATICAPIPNGGEYRIQLGGGHNILSWSELR